MSDARRSSRWLIDDSLAPGESVLLTVEGICAAMTVTTIAVVVALPARGSRDPIVRRYPHEELRDVAVTRPRYGIGWLSLRAGDPGAQAVTRVRYLACRRQHVEAAALLIRERMRPAAAEDDSLLEPGASCGAETDRRRRLDRPSETSVLRDGSSGQSGDASP
jgi:hypothetical protein